MQRLRRWWVGLLCASWFDTVAWAQTFTLDPVLVAEPHVDEEELEGLAAEVHAELERSLATRFVVVPFSEVPPYDDYDASIYLDSCPEGEYVSCAWVLGQRASTTWTVAVEVTEAPRPKESDVDMAEASITILDVPGAVEVVRFRTRLVPEHLDALAEGVALVLDRMVHGAGDRDDVRGTPVDPKVLWEARRRAAREAAEELALGEQELRVLERSGVEVLEPPKLTGTDLSAYDDRDDRPPWESLGMPRSAYRRFENSGVELDVWKQRSRGRFLQLMITAGAGFDGGPTKHVYDGRWVLGADTLQVVEIAEEQRLVGGPSVGFSGELAFGVHPWIEVGFGLVSRSARIRYGFYREVEGEELGEEVSDAETFRYTYELRARVGFVPFPQARVRPTLHAMAGYWRGIVLEQVVTPVGGLSGFGRPVQWCLYLGPGVEVSASERVLVFVRAVGSMAVSGARTWSSHSGERLLRVRSELPDPGSPLGYEVSAGVTVRVGPWTSRRSPNTL